MEAVAGAGREDGGCRSLVAAEPEGVERNGGRRNGEEEEFVGLSPNKCIPNAVVKNTVN